MQSSTPCMLHAAWALTAEHSWQPEYTLPLVSHEAHIISHAQSFHRSTWAPGWLGSSSLAQHLQHQGSWVLGSAFWSDTPNSTP